MTDASFPAWDIPELETVLLEPFSGAALLSWILDMSSGPSGREGCTDHARRGLAPPSLRRDTGGL